MAAEIADGDGTRRMIVGDAVQVFSRSADKWVRDAVIVRELEEAGEVEGCFQMPAGALKVLYDQNRAAKWVDPAHFAAELRAADFCVGDRVRVFCRDLDLWVSDGLIEEATLAEEGDRPAGSMKVKYNLGEFSKWVTPERFCSELRPFRDWNPEEIDCYTAKVIEDVHVADLLTAKQRGRFPGILAELEGQGQKTGHWSWWAFPTGMPGARDPCRTYVTLVTARRLFGEGSAEHLWQQVLEKVCDLVDHTGMEAMPRIDHGRIHHFVEFWRPIRKLPEWFTAVLHRLSKHDWLHREPEVFAKRRRSISYGSRCCLQRDAKDGGAVKSIRSRSLSPRARVPVPIMA